MAHGRGNVDAQVNIFPLSLSLRPFVAMLINDYIRRARSRVGVAVTNGRLYAFGGFNGQERLSTVEVYDPKSRAWTQGRAMKCKRSAVGVAALGDVVYICGGYDGLTSLNTVEW